MGSTLQYGVTLDDYLRRARECLDQGRPASLFYAAFELRAGIETRMHEYLHPHRERVKKKNLGLKVSQLGRELERVFKRRDRIVRLTFIEPDTGEVIGTLCHTPVTKRLEKRAERLGEYLHAPRIMPLDDPWWREIRECLERVYRELEEANRGTLMGPPLLDPTGRRASLITEVRGEVERRLGERMKQTGSTIKIDVRYLESVTAPDESPR